MIKIPQKSSGFWMATLLLLCSTQSLPYSQSLPLCMLVLIFFTFRMVDKNIFSRQIIYIAAFLIGYYIILSVVHNNFHYYKCIQTLSWVVASYVFLKEQKDKSFFWLEKALYIFSLISVPFFILEIIGESSFYSFLSTIGLRVPETSVRVDREAYHIIVYCTNATIGKFPRNCSIYFEPGLHACMINLCIVLNYLRTKRLFTKEQNLLLVVLLTTTSTTGFILYFMFLGSVYLKKNILFLVVLVIGLFVFLNMFQFEMIQEKIRIAFEQVGNYDDIFAQSAYFNSVEHPDRLVSLELGWIDLCKYPVWGHGSIESSLGGWYGGTIVPASGLAHIMMFYGGSALIILGYAICKMAVFMKNIYHEKFLLWFMPLWFIMMSISYYPDAPIYIVFYMVGIVLTKKIYNRENNSSNI